MAILVLGLRIRSKTRLAGSTHAVCRTLKSLDVQLWGEWARSAGATAVSGRSRKLPLPEIPVNHYSRPPLVGTTVGAVSSAGHVVWALPLRWLPVNIETS